MRAPGKEGGVATVLHSTPGHDLEDRELVRHVQSGDERCLDLLLKRHRGFVRGISSRYFLRGFDQEDVL